VVIRRSAAGEVGALIADVAGADEIARESAVARLRIIGARAVPRLLDLACASSASTASRLAALNALDGILDARGAKVVAHLLYESDAAVAAAAAAVVRPFVTGPGGARLLDVLTDIVLDERRDARIRNAALTALSGLPARTLKPLLERVQAHAETALATSKVESRIRPLPDDPTKVRRRLAGPGSRASIADLHRVVGEIRSREQSAREPAERREWMTARAVAHQVLAARGSRVALYDLRESIEQAEGPLPVEFLTAVETIGDAACATAVAGAFASASREGPADWWSTHLASAFRAIVERERLTQRHPELQKIERRWPGLLALLLTPKKRGSTRRSGPR
jgi:hypothetical protein